MIAMDSPRARKSGSFNWGSTLWHEFAHVITLQMTRHNVPRWFSEGVSVYEERRARPGWGDDLTAHFLKAYQEGKALKVSELNSGMMRPKFPEQIAFSYYQASLVCELIEEKFGFAKIREALALFADNLPTRRGLPARAGLGYGHARSGIWAFSRGTRPGQIRTSRLQPAEGTRRYEPERARQGTADLAPGEESQ